MKTLLNEAVPRLGFGLMRLQELENGEINTNLAGELIDRFMEKGFRYFDTAYTYLDGRSEPLVKQFLADRYPRESYYVATKLPLFACKTIEACREAMETSLRRLGTGYVDFWLLHSMQEKTMQLCDEIGAWELLKEYKAAGKAKHIGFSFHDKPEVLDAFLNTHPEAEFVQLQINYLDWEDEKVQAKACYDVVRAHNLPVIIMEPVKGGALATGNEQVKALMEGTSPAEMALRWCAELEGVMMILSGMSDRKQLEENTDTMKAPKALSTGQKENLEKAAEVFHSIPKVPCTQCKYCIDGCPRHIRIHWNLALYSNVMVYQNPERDRAEFAKFLQDTGKPSSCIGCGKCEKVCPQHLPIRELLKKAAEVLE